MVRKTNQSHLVVKNKSKQIRFLTSQEVNRLLPACDTTNNHGKRDLALLKILLCLGLRVGELVTLSPDCVVRDAENQRTLALMGIHRTLLSMCPRKSAGL